MNFLNVPAISYPELLIDGEDMKVFEKVMLNVSILCFNRMKYFLFCCIKCFNCSYLNEIETGSW